MLQSLRIKNLALVEDLTWELGPGLVCVTGETGAGKSMIVGALSLILGERADRSMIRTGEENCTVEAVFGLEDPAAANVLLESSGLDPCQDCELIIKRTMTSSGQNRQFVNNGPATLATLKDLGRHLVDLHGPHNHQSLLSRERQLMMLDAFSGIEDKFHHYRGCYERWRAAARDLDELKSSELATDAEIELLQHQVKEIEAAQLRGGEEDELLQRHRMAANATRLGEWGGAALQKLAGDDDAIIERLRQLQRMLRELERLDPSLVDPIKGAESAIMELEELESTLRDYLDRLEFDPGSFAALEERINVIESLKRKYGGSVESALDHLERATVRLCRVENRGEAIAALETKVTAAKSDVDAAARTLTAARKKAAPRLAREIASHLLDLGFKRALFEVALDDLAEPGARGREEADFLFAPNPGEPAKPLRLIASSGEMSRLMLAVKSALAREDSIPLLVFDEIDANVGGEIAAAVGRKMAALGQAHQVIAITHMPQVAALAASHYEVTKEFSHNRTRSDLRTVSGEERVTEIARMLGGNESSARAHARNLLAAAGKPPRDRPPMAGRREKGMKVRNPG
jgi:DNA repair protein RecN (Recombination protein N)